MASAAGTVPLPPDAGAGASGDPAQRLLLALLDLWLDKFDCIGQAGARKLSALALCTLLPAGGAGVLERLDAMAGHITAVWYEVRDGEGGV